MAVKDWDEWRRRSRRGRHLKLAISSASVCVLMAALALSCLLRGRPIPRKALEAGPVLFLVFAGGAALNFCRWKRAGEDR